MTKGQLGTSSWYRIRRNLRCGPCMLVFSYLKHPILDISSPILIIPRAVLHLVFDNRGIPLLTDHLIVAESQEVSIMSTLTCSFGLI